MWFNYDSLFIKSGPIFQVNYPTLKYLRLNKSFYIIFELEVLLLFKIWFLTKDESVERGLESFENMKILSSLNGLIIDLA
jgi:hypothetical protein